jgi:hypothetical protein
MKTAMELALDRIEMLYGMKPDDIHWEMFKNDCMEKEKEQIKITYNIAKSDLLDNIEKTSEEYYNQRFKYEKQNTRG